MLKKRFGKPLKIVLIVVIVIVSIEILIKLGGFILEWVNHSKQEEQTIKQEATGNKISSATKTFFVDGNHISLVMKIFFDNINNGEFQKAYDILDPECKALSFENLTKFEEYCKANYVSKYGKFVTVLKYDYLGDDTYYCKIEVRDFEPVEDSPNQIFQEYVTLKFTEPYKATISMKGLVGSTKPNVTANSGNIVFTLGKVNRFADDMIASVSVTNNESIPISILQDAVLDVRVNLRTINGQDITSVADIEKGLAPTDFEVQPGQTVEFEIKFFMDKTDTLKSITFTGIKVGSETKIVELKVKEP